MSPHGGRLAVDVLRNHGVDTLFTLSGGHLFVLYDGCVQAGLRLVDTRHEQSAAFAAEGYAKVTRRVGCAALTAGPGVTNGVSAMTSMSMNGSPVLVLAGRAPMARWGSGSLQELDHLPIVESVVKSAATATGAASIVAEVHAALLAARTPHRGPAFVDIPLDAFAPDDVTIPAVDTIGLAGDEPDPEAIAEVARLLGAAERPVLVAGGDVYWGGAEGALVRLAEAARVPVFVNGMGRGTIPADHDLAFSRTRALAFRGADLVVVVGTPLDFRLGFGSFGDARVVHICDSKAGVARHVDLAGAVAGDLAAALSALAELGAPAAARSAHDGWVGSLRDEEKLRRAADDAALGRTPHRSSRRACTASSASASSTTRSSSAMVATSCRTQASTSTPTSRVPSSTRALTAAWGWARDTRSGRAWRAPTAGSC